MGRLGGLQSGSNRLVRECPPNTMVVATEAVVPTLPKYQAISSWPQLRTFVCGAVHSWALKKPF